MKSNKSIHNTNLNMNSHKKLDSKNLDIIDSVGGDYAPKLKSRRSSQALSKSSRKG